MSWLRQQQLKLAARRDERSPAGKQWRQDSGSRILGELRNVQRGLIRQDGYASDSAIIDGDDDSWINNSTVTQVRKRETNYTKERRNLLFIIIVT